MPRSILNAYSDSVRIPIAVTAKASPFAILRAQKSSLRAIYRDMPDRVKQRAVFAFMVTKPGKTLFSAAISKTQPINTIEPITVTAMPDPLEKAWSKEMIRDTDCATLGKTLFNPYKHRLFMDHRKPVYLIKGLPDIFFFGLMGHHDDGN